MPVEMSGKEGGLGGEVRRGLGRLGVGLKAIQVSGGTERTERSEGGEGPSAEERGSSGPRARGEGAGERGTSGEDRAGRTERARGGRRGRV